MTASVAEQILARVLAVVRDVPGFVGVERNRLAALGQDELPHANIRRGDAQTVQHAERLQRSLLEFDLVIRAAGADYETTTDALHVAADAALAADSALAALGRGLLYTGSEIVAEDADFTAGGLTARYQIHVLTRPGDLAHAIT